MGSERSINWETKEALNGQKKKTENDDCGIEKGYYPSGMTKL